MKDQSDGGPPQVVDVNKLQPIELLTVDGEKVKRFFFVSINFLNKFFSFTYFVCFTFQVIGRILEKHADNTLAVWLDGFGVITVTQIPQKEHQQQQQGEGAEELLERIEKEKEKIRQVNFFCTFFLKFGLFFLKKKKMSIKQNKFFQDIALFQPSEEESQEKKKEEKAKPKTKGELKQNPASAVINIQSEDSTESEVKIKKLFSIFKILSK